MDSWQWTVQGSLTMSVFKHLFSAIPELVHPNSGSGPDDPRNRRWRVFVVDPQMAVDRCQEISRADSTVVGSSP